MPRKGLMPHQLRSRSRMRKISNADLGVERARAELRRMIPGGRKKIEEVIQGLERELHNKWAGDLQAEIEKRSVTGKDISENGRVGIRQHLRPPAFIRRGLTKLKTLYAILYNQSRKYKQL